MSYESREYPRSENYWTRIYARLKVANMYDLTVRCIRTFCFHLTNLSTE